MRDNSLGLRLLGWIPGFLLALPLAALWVIAALMIAEPDGPGA